MTGPSRHIFALDADARVTEDHAVWVTFRRDGVGGQGFILTPKLAANLAGQLIVSAFRAKWASR